MAVNVFSRCLGHGNCRLGLSSAPSAAGTAPAKECSLSPLFAGQIGRIGSFVYAREKVVMYCRWHDCSVGNQRCLTLLSVVQVSLVATILLFLPGINLLPFKQAATGISWSVILVFAAGLSLTRGLTNTGAAAWLGHLVSSLFHGLPPTAGGLSLSLFFLFWFGPHLLPPPLPTLPLFCRWFLPPGLI